MDKEKIAIEIYTKIIIFLKQNKLTQRGVARRIKITPQTFSDNMSKLATGAFPKLDFLLDLQTELKIDLGVNFK